MGREKTTQSTDSTSSSTQTATATGGEQTLNAQQQAILSAQQGDVTQNNALLSSLIRGIISGQGLPGIFSGLEQGISAEDIGTQSARVARRAQPGFESLGILDSGSAFQATAREVGESVLFPAAQFNVATALDVLGLGVNAAGNEQSLNIGRSNVLGARLAGLRSISSTGQSTSNIVQTAPNPFLSSFQTSLGKSLGTLGGGTSGGAFQFGIGRG